MKALLVGLAAMLVIAAVHLPAADTDLDAFMQQVLLRRDDNWKKLQQYILDEREQIELRGADRQPIWGERHDYTWYIRDGFFVRSPVRFNGVEIGDADRRKYEDEFLRRTAERERRGLPQISPAGSNSAGAAVADALLSDGAAGGAATPPAPGDTDTAAVSTDQTADGLLKQVREPQFVSSAYFLRFKFEQGKYALVGREKLDGNDVMRIEYYPANLYSDRQKRRMAGDHDPRDPKDAAVQQMMNKVALVTLWVEPASHQIVKYTFDNIDFDFLPARWLIRLDGVRASMTMSRPFPDVWLPRELEFLVDAQMAAGRFSLRWGVEYRDYRQADVKSKFRVVPPR